MAEKPQPASLHDLLAYIPESYFSQDELALIQNTFKDSRVTKVLRKALLPSVGDPDLPLEEMGKDFWLVGRDWATIPAEEVKPIAIGRQEAIKFIMGGLIMLKQIANSEPVNQQVLENRRRKDSAK